MDLIQLTIESEDPDTWDEQILTIINTAIQSSYTAPIKDAALALDAVYTEYTTQNPDKDPEGFLTCFWEHFYSFAAQIPHDSPQQDRLALIVKELKDLPSRKITLEQWGDVQLWAGMPLFAAEFPRDWRAITPQSLPDDTKKTRFLNTQSYAARVLSHRLVPLEMNAIWALSAAVEGDTIPVRGSPDIVSTDPTAIEDLGFKTAVAAVWITYAGGVLYGRDEEVEGTGGGPLWVLDKKEARAAGRKYRGTGGLCGQRWGLWKEQFGVIRDCEGVEGGTRELAGGVVEVMEGIERGGA